MLLWIERQLANGRAVSRVSRRATIFLIGMALWSCSSQAPLTSASISPTNQALSRRSFANTSAHVIRGVHCSAYGDTGPGQDNYRSSEVALQGVPKLSTREIKQLRKIANHVHSSTLRWAILNFQGRRQFIVFDATLGPCSAQAPGYEVLNEKGQNSFYQPGEMPYYTHGGPP